MDNGVVKKVDELGRIVIPKDIRKNLKINNGDVLKISVDGQKIQLSKYSDVFNNIDEIKKIFEAFISIFDKNIIFTDREKVLLSNLEIVDLNIDSAINDLINNREYSFENNKKTYSFGNKKIEGYYYIYPIISSIAGIGSIIIYSTNQIENIYEKLIKFISLYISKNIDISC